jgi:hypothetical protein
MQQAIRSDNVNSSLSAPFVDFLWFHFDSVVSSYGSAMDHRTPTTNTLGDRFEDVRTRVDTAARRSNRSAAEITLVAISKTHPTETLRAGLEAGITKSDGCPLASRGSLANEQSNPGS